jgi:uncharacterized RDD family membrane protein YckC
MDSETVVNPEVTAERAWHYVLNGQSIGPIPQSEILKMLTEGHLGADTLVWTESMTEWTPAGRIEAFHNQLAALPLVVVPPTTTLRQRAESARAQGVPQVRPWPRCLARWFDLLCVGAVLVGMIAGFAGIVHDVPPYLLTLATPFLWVFVEALLLSTWGTTPGKWLFSTWVSDAMGNRLSFSHALSRAFAVWFRGLGFNLPIVPLITQIVAYVKLRDQGITSWDREGRFAVIHERLGPARVTVAMIALIGVIALGVWSRVMLILQRAGGV